MENNNFENQWTSYASAAPTSKSTLLKGSMLLATGAALSMQHSANASIIYTAVNHDYNFNNTSAQPAALTYAVGLPGGNNLIFAGYLIPHTGLLHGQGGTGNVGGVKAVQGSFVVNTLAPSNHPVKNFSAGNAIAGNFKTVNQFLTFQAPLKVQSGPEPFGSFPINPGVNDYAGFRFSTGGGNYDYGYITLAVNNTSGPAAYPNQLSIVGFTYNDTPNGPITAGEPPTPPPASPVPEASNKATALLLLACAGGSLATWRKRQLAAA